MPTISVIVPNYNHAPFLPKRLDSILKQTYQDFELIILDDFSSDNSREILNNYCNHPKVTHIIFNEINSGNTFRQWLKGIELAQGDYIWIAESDDFSDYQFLEKINSILLQNRCSLCFTNSYIVDASNNVKGIYNNEFLLYQNDFIQDGQLLIQKYFGYQNIIPNASGVIFKKEYLSHFLLEDIVRFKINGDWFLWINLLMCGTCAFLAEPLNYFRHHEGASSHANVENFKNIEEAFVINQFLKKHNFDINKTYWLRAWINQANYKFSRIIKSNFINIYKEALPIFPFPISYLLYFISKRKMQRFKTKTKK